jgi:hypothetical protein
MEGPGTPWASKEQVLRPKPWPCSLWWWWCNYYRPCQYKYYWTAVKPEERGDMFLRNVGCLRRRIPEDHGTISKFSPSWNKKLVRLQIEITCRPCRLQSWRSKTQTKFWDVNYRSAYNLSSSYFLTRSVDVRIPKFNFTFFSVELRVSQVFFYTLLRYGYITHNNTAIHNSSYSIKNWLRATWLNILGYVQALFVLNRRRIYLCLHKRPKTFQSDELTYC